MNEKLSYSPGPLSLMGVRYAVLPSDEPVASEHWKLVDTGEIEPRVTLRGADATTNTPQPYSLYEFASPMPRAFVIGHTEIAYSGEAMIGQLSQIDPREVVIVVEDPWPEGDQQDFQPAEIVELSPTRAVINAELDANGFLVLAENYAKGWKATVNGKPAKVVPVYIGFRGVALSPGKHRVEFHYEPPLCNVGLILTAISLAVVGLLLWNEFRPLPAGDSSDDGAGDG